MNKINFDTLFTNLKTVATQISNKPFTDVTLDVKKMEKKSMEKISHIHKMNLIITQLEKLEEAINNPKKIRT